ncbi:hypothetical protein K438DRAFT_1981669 [Mycena galopus ATCC 62051]|nr:hypothetical protein K438DRAFT_1981669 [Mycena galopus ATCC 62051]
MPEHLVLPPELHRLVLACETELYHDAWGTYRLVCKAWKEHVEFLAKTEWIWDATFHYPGEMMRVPGHGKVFFNGDFSFQRLEGDSAIFQVVDCAAEFKKQLIEICKRSPPPDVEIGDIVDDVEISEMSVDWDTLTITCPWRPLVGRLMAEELRVQAYRHQSNREMMTAAKRVRHAAPGGEVGLDVMMNFMEMFADKWLEAYVAVRTARHGRSDRRGDERLKLARQAASMRDL